MINRKLIKKLNTIVPREKVPVIVLYVEGEDGKIYRKDEYEKGLRIPVPESEFEVHLDRDNPVRIVGM